MVDRIVNMRGRGLRGQSLADIARRSGNWGVQPSDTDRQALDKFALYAIEQNPGFKGDKGDTGAANSTYESVDDIRQNANPLNVSAILARDDRRDFYVWVQDGLGVGTAGLDYITSDFDDQGIWKRFDGPLYAGNFGVVGDASTDANGDPIGTDDTAAVQAFLDLGSSLGRICYFGSLRPLLSGPIFIHNGSCVFDRRSFTASGENAGVSRGEPGFYVTGSGYTAVTVSGICTALCATVCGGGDPTFDADGNITADTRPNINGFQFGNPLGASRGTLILSNIGWARATKLRRGILVINAFDNTFSDLSTEGCGDGNVYGFAIEDGGNTTNECKFGRIQVEFGANKAFFVSPNTLSCTFEKIHTERAIGNAKYDTWVFGPGEYTSVRLSAQNPDKARVYINGQSENFKSWRSEGNIPVYLQTTGGEANFTNTESGNFLPAPGSNGIVNFFGGLIRWTGATQNWRAYGAMIDATIGACPDGYWPVLDHCRTSSLSRSDDSAAIEICGGRVESFSGGQWRDIRITNNARVALAGGGITLHFCKMTLDESSEIVGNLTLNTVGFRFGGRIEGDLCFQSPRQTLVTDSGHVTGTVYNNGPPEGDSYLDGAPKGSFCKNLTPVVQGTPKVTYTFKDTSNVDRTITTGGQYFIVGWQNVNDVWTPAQVATGN